MNPIEEREEDNDEADRLGYDILLASCLWLLTLLFFIESIRLTFFVDVPAAQESDWLTAPGMMPLLLSGGLLLMLSAIIVHSYRSSKKYNGSNRFGLVKKWISNKQNKHKAAQALLLIIFIFVLVGNIHFGIAVGLYLFSAMALARAGKLYWIAIIAIVFAAIITTIFGTLMKIPLP